LNGNNIELTRVLTILTKLGTVFACADHREMLALITTTVVEALPETAGGWAVTWLYNPHLHQFDRHSRTLAGTVPNSSEAKELRADGLEARAINRQRPLFSYDPDHPETGPDPLRRVCYPMLLADKPVGVLVAGRKDGHPFSSDELLLLDHIAQLGAAAIRYGEYGETQATSGSAVDTKVRALEKLHRASSLISSRTNLDKTLQEILTIGLDLTAAQYGSLEFYDRQRNELVVRALVGSHDRLVSAEPLPVNETSVIGWVARHRQSIRIDNLREAPWRDIYQPLPVGPEMSSELAVPLVGASGRLEGVINIESPRPNAFSQQDQQLLEALATHAVIAVQEIRLLDVMQEIVQELLTARYDDLLKLIIERACELINVAAGSIWIVSERDELVVRQSTVAGHIGWRAPLHSFIGQAVRLMQPVTIDDIRQHPAFSGLSLASEQEWVSAIVVPLLATEDDVRPLGSFSLHAGQLRDFSDWDKKVLAFLANLTTVAIRDARQLELLKQARERQATAEAMAAAGDVAANLMHQLNNKFGAISVRLQGIEEKSAALLAANPYLAHNLAEIALTTDQALSILRESMVPLQPMSPHPVALLACVHQALRRAMLPPTITVQLRGLEALPEVLAGEKQLEMVFYNLFDNAGKAMAGHGRLEISGRVAGDTVAISVLDTGPGIPPANQSKIFELASGEGWQTGGLSFGLWWVKTFVERFGGRVQLNSDVGRGSEFTLFLQAAGSVESHV
jgi:signal transduction histidine kinase